MGLGNGRTSLFILWDIVLCQDHDKILTTTKVDLYKLVRFQSGQLASGRISMGTIATIHARAGERNGCIEVRFLGRSYDLILNKIS